MSATENTALTEKSPQFWWVNQGQSYSAEKEGGYLWSPKTNQNGNRNAFYDNMPKVQEGDYIVHWVSRKGFVAISQVTKGGHSSNKPSELAGYSWNDEGWRVDTKYYELHEPLLPDREGSYWRKLHDLGAPFQSDLKVKMGYISGLTINCMTELFSGIPSEQIPKKLEGLNGVLNMERTHWLFQFNPKLFMRSAFNELDEISWLIRIKKHRESIKLGETVYIWESGDNAGIIAVGEISRLPLMEEEGSQEKEFALDTDKFDGKQWRVKVKINQLLSRPITRQICKDNPSLSSLRVLKMAQGTNYEVTDEEHSEIQKLLNNEEVTVTNEPYTLENALLDLFLDREQIQEINESLKLKKNVVLQGPPGVGKTFVAQRLAYLLIGEKKRSNVEMIQFHQSYAYEDFVQGLRPDPNANGSGFKLTNGIFYNFCLAAKAKPNEKFVFIIDEINRGNLSKIFGELLMLIESDKRSSEYDIKLTYSDSKFHIPRNVHILGMMNTADRSLALVDYALRRRFRFFDIEPQFGKSFQDHLSAAGASDELIQKIVQRVSALNEVISSEDKNLGKGFCIGHSYFCPPQELSNPDSKWYEGVVKNEIKPLLEEYWFDDLDKAEDRAKQLL